MKLFFFAIVLAVAGVGSSYGQTIIKAGYIIGPTGDSTEGFIEDRIDRKMMREAIFFKSMSQSPQQYNASEIMEFGSQGRIFRRIKKDSAQYTFGKVANDGTLSLVVFRNNGGTKYFVKNNITGKSAIIERPKRTDAGVNTSKGSPIFVQKLLTVANLSAAKGVLKKLSYGEKNFRRFVTAYNSKSDPSSARVYYNDVIVHNVIGYSLVNYNTLTSTAGHSFSYFFGKENRDRHRKGFWFYGVRYQKVSDTKEVPGQGLEYNQNISDLVILPLSYRYAPGKKRIKPYLSASCGLDLHITEEFLGFPTLTTVRKSTTNAIFSPGVGVSFQFGKQYINVESTCDINNFVKEVYAYRFGIAVDL
ncbi:MAG: hypothetical protein ACOYXT_05425 [Bacteroidota bacterium]